MTAKTISISIVMPCLNEAATIEPCIARAQEALEILSTRHGLHGEVLVADNGSTDGSQGMARSVGARVINVPSKGYGAALSAGFASAQGQYIVMGDSDMSYDFVESVPMVEALIGGADICMGSRFLGEIKPGAMPWKNRYIGNPVLSAILRILFNTPISDSHCGLRALSRGAIERLNLTSSGMEFASEIVLKAVLLKLKFAEVPVTLSPDQRGRPPHLRPWRDGFRHLFYMFMLSPAWLFMIPAILLTIFGAVVSAILLISNDVEMVQIGPFAIGDHWSIVASATFVLGVQAGIFGLVSLVYGCREKFRIPTQRLRKFLDISQLHYWILIGLGVFSGGLVWSMIITAMWISSDYGQLNEIRNLSASVTLIVIGGQIFFGGFFMSIVSGNKVNHSLED
ncbi:MAG: glycosyltransferase family 2 protein [Paracoccaceae bacterium]